MNDPKKVILDELQMDGITQYSITLTYCFCIKQIKGESDFAIINQAIIDKWGEVGLERIKNKAWRLINAKNKKRRY
jgi:hypothetical protein